MTRKTQRQSKRKQSTKSDALQTIPELRQSFDYIDEFTKNRIASGIPKEQLVKEIQHEWLRVFSKRIQKKNATAFVEHLMELSSRRRGIRGTRRGTKKRTHGGMAPVMDPTTQPGTYLASGLPPTSTGHYPLANGAPSAYGSLVAHVNKGFQIPEIAGHVEGQPAYPTHPPPSLGSNRIQGGSRALRYKRKQGGSLVGSALSQVFNGRLVESTSPSSILQDGQNAWYGRGIGPSPDQVQRTPSYQLSGPTGIPMRVKIDV